MVIKMYGKSETDADYNIVRQFLWEYESIAKKNPNKRIKESEVSHALSRIYHGTAEKEQAWLGGEKTVYDFVALLKGL